MSVTVKLIIELPTDKYLAVKNNMINDFIYDAVKHGIPLPKEHGNLIDVDKCNIIAQNCYTTEDMRIIRRFLNNAPIVIEADKTESEKV